MEYDTPLYVYDLSRIERNFLSFKEAFGGRKSLICYALKANSNLGILSALARLGSGADCVSIGEVKRALLAGIPKYKIIFSGVGKRAEEIEEALKLDILFLNVESSEELKTIEQIAKKLSSSQNPHQHLQQNSHQNPRQSPHQTDSSPSSPKKARISIRVNPNIDAKTHPYISTGLSENKFGLDIESAKQAYLYAHNSPFLDPVGIHFHIGSQICELAPIAQSAQKIANLAKSLLALGIEIRFFDIGGGLGIRYEEEEEIALYDYAQAILSALKGSDFTIICEPGRRIVGNAGVLLTKVLYEKRTANKRFVIVDSGMNDLMRPALYDAVHKVQVYSKASDKSSDKSNDKQSTKADIVGPVCESSDTFLREVKLGELKQGDILGFDNAGAYGYSMASNYNTRAKPAEVGIYQKDSTTQVVLLKKRETFSELVANELECLKDFAKGTKYSTKTKSSLECALDFENLSNFDNLSNADSSRDFTHAKKSKKSTKTQKSTKSTK
nr:diaminopimelate decarboxylase [Helicobacter sp. MIT 01-3238]